MTNKNKVELIGYYGGDETHAMSAWTSTSRELTQEKIGRIQNLLKMLAEAGHHSPFEKSYLHFLVTCDTASHIHFLKHRIGVSVNAESARYKELKEDKYHIPDDWPALTTNEYKRHIESCYEIYHWLVAQLEGNGLSRKRAKESARFVLPYANQLTLDVGFNFRSFMHFQKLRNKEDAQKEIKDIAENMLKLVKDTQKFNHSLEGFGYA
jgi:thymidylate synthase (FAD)